MGHEAKWEYFRVMYERYRQAKGKSRTGILDEFCLTTNYNRKYAIRLLNGPRPGRQREKKPRGRKPRYGQQVISILAGVWEAAGYPWSVRLKALLPAWMPWIRRRYRLSAELEQQLLGLSARQMDRRLGKRKREQKRKIYGRTKPGSLLKHHIPVKTDSWDVKTPGFAEIDLVAHSGDSAEGEFAHTLNLTDIHTGWTESRAVLGKGEVAVQAALHQIQASLPFHLRVVDSDNGSEFINWHLKRWCDAEHIQLTRGRPYKKDDNAHIEQKNWTHVRKLLGWERYDMPAAVEAVNILYREELRLWMNLYLPSVKLVKKIRVGAKLRRVYSPAQTPLERVLASGQADAPKGKALQQLRARLDPFQLSQRIERKLAGIYALANRRWSPKATATRRPTAVEKPRRGKVQNNGLSLRAWKSRKRRGIPTFPQPRRRRLSGYILNVSTAQPKVTFLNGLIRGTGANGKSTFLNVIGHVLGEYAHNLPFSAFELKGRSDIPHDIAGLVGRRFVTAQETSESAQLNEARLKMLTGGDPVAARFLYKGLFTFKPVAKIWLAFNHKPEVADDSEGFWRRIRLIPFKQSFTDSRDDQLEEKLKAEAPGILNWALRG